MKLRGIFLSAVLGMPAIQCASAKEDAYVEGEALVTFRQDVPEETAKAALGRRAIRLAEKFGDIARERKVSGLVRDRSRTTAALLEELRSDPTVEFAEPNYIRRPNVVRPDDTYYTRLWGLENTGQTLNATPGTSGVDTRFIQAWNLARTSSTEPVVVVIDSGVDISHPDLSANIWTNPGEIPGNGIDDDGNGYVDDVHGYDFASNTGTMKDSGYHGTHVAGTVAASGRNGAGVIGVQYKAKIIPAKVSNDGENFVSSATIAACNYAVALKNKGVNIVAVNASYGGGSFSLNERAAIIALRDAGIVFCAAAGNDGTNNDSEANYPSNYALTNIVAVAALSQTNALADFSNYGATSVDIAAPGTNIWSAAPLDHLFLSSSVKVGATTYAATNIEFSGTTGQAGIMKSVISCGSGLSAANFPAGVNGNIALIQRGTNTFVEKVTLAKAAGAVGVLLYNNTVDTGSWTLESGVWPPALQLTQADGQAILASLPATATLINYPDPSLPPYQYLDGTSMACPHVAGAVAFAAWNFPAETMAQRISRILNNKTTVAALSGKMTTGGRLDLLKMIDTDNDGLPDWWETEKFGSLARTGAEDTDGDGFSNLREFLANTVPTSAGSRFAFSNFQPVAGPGGNNVALTFPTVPYRSYKVEWSADLQPPWTQVGATVTGTGSPIQVQDENSAGRRFYRLSLIED